MGILTDYGQVIKGQCWKNSKSDKALFFGGGGLALGGAPLDYHDLI